MVSEARRPHVGLATCAEFADLHEDDRPLLELLRQRGVTARPAVWDDPALDWRSFDLVVVRSTWDYPPRLPELLAWAGSLTRVLNPLPMLAWNANKRYLRDLAAAGVPVVPTRFAGEADTFEPPAGRFVVKPAVSCSSKDTASYSPSQTDEARGHVRRLQREGRVAMVQPYLVEVEEQGEFCLVFLGGKYSHAVRRGAMLTHGRPTVGGLAPPEAVRPHEATPEQLTLAEGALRSVPGDASRLLYARVDLVPSREHGLMVLELELFEPSLFLAYGAGSSERLADLIASAATLSR
jgi:glutathione synthase/RimK-type ligase-like ATP-grasp enzyme